MIPIESFSYKMLGQFLLFVLFNYLCLLAETKQTGTFTLKFSFSLLALIIFTLLKFIFITTWPSFTCNIYNKN